MNLNVFGYLKPEYSSDWALRVRGYDLEGSGFRGLRLGLRVQEASGLGGFESWTE